MHPVGIASAMRWVSAFEQTRRTALLPSGGDRRSVLKPHRTWGLFHGIRLQQVDLHQGHHRRNRAFLGAGFSPGFPAVHMDFGEDAHANRFPEVDHRQ